MILDYLTNMTNRQHAILKLLHKINDDANPKKPTTIMTAFDLENIQIADEMAKKAAKTTAKIYNVVDKDGNYIICTYCGGIISWDLRPERNLPLHCDKIGQIVGDGSCHG